MISQFIEWLIKAGEDKKKKLVIELIIFFIIVAPILSIGVFSYFETKKDFTASVFARRESLAELAAAELKEKFDRIIDVGISFATRVQFRKHIEAGNWNEAIKILESVPKDFPYIDTVGLFDTEGTIWAVTPPIPEAIGQNFSYRDYYKGISKNWQPYISEVFKRAPQPRSNVVSVAVPIKSDVPLGAEQKIIGILLLTVNLDTILDWSREIKIGSGGFVYFVDRNGNVAGHPKISSQNEVVNFSEVSAVKKALKGESGVEVNFNPVENEERLSAFAPVPSFGWVVVVQEPTYSAFAAMNKNLNRLLIIYGIFLILDIFLAYLIVRLGDTILTYKQNEKSFLESIGDGVCVIDRYWNITLWNKAAEEISGWSAKEALGRPLREIIKFIREKDRSENVVFIEEAMLYGRIGYMENNTFLIRKDGQEIPVGDSAAPVFDTSGKVVGAIIVFRDITKEREADKIREEVMFQTVHDLRAPATAIKLAAESSRDAEFLSHNPEILKESIGLIQEANARMLGLINSLLESARNEAGKVKHVRVVLSNIIQGAVKEFTPVATRKSIKIEYASSQDLPQVFANAERLKEIFSNLIDNAIKYNKDGGTVTITHQEEKGFIKTLIKDTGIGISEENLSKLFTPYFRVDTGQPIQGTGLGLFIVKKFVEEIGGHIAVDSKIGQGATFIISLPAAEK